METGRHARLLYMKGPEVSYHDEAVEDDLDFRASRETWRRAIAEDDGLRHRAVELQQAMDRHRYTYQFDWLGVPIVRLPDDIVILQEILFVERPDCIIETGIARGGSLLLNASLQSLVGVKPRVMGIDINIFQHTRNAIDGSALAGHIVLVEGNSASQAVRDVVHGFVKASNKVMLILDSDHSHSHVLSELLSLAPLLPSESLVLVADTIIEEMPDGYYSNRHWGRGNSPLTAIHEFVSSDSRFALEPAWNRRAVVTEFRDGILRKTA